MIQDDAQSRKNESAVFGPNGPLMFDALRSIVRDLDHAPVHYEFTSIEEHTKLFKQDLAAGQRVWATEILYHAHFASVATLVRAYRWAEGCLSAYSSGLFLPFCASARGLLESVGDSYVSLVRVPQALCHIRENLRSNLASNRPPIICDYKPVEDLLLHFSHARRPTRAERGTLPEYAIAKESAEYTKAIEHLVPGGFADWYKELCGHTHPADQSIGYMLLQADDGRRVQFVPSTDRECLAIHLENHQARLEELLRVAQVPAMVLLRVLLHFDLPQLHIKAVADLNMTGLPYWKQCAAVLGVEP